MPNRYRYAYSSNAYSHAARCHQRRAVSYDSDDDPFEQESEEEEDFAVPLDHPPSLKMEDYFQDLPIESAKRKGSKNPLKMANVRKPQKAKVKREKKRTATLKRPNSDLARSVYEKLMADQNSSWEESNVEAHTQLQGLDLSLSSESSQNVLKKEKLELRRTRSSDIQIHHSIQCSTHQWDQLKRTQQGMLEFETSKLSCDPNFYRVNVGPSPRGSMIVKCSSKHAAIAVIWRVNLTSTFCLEKLYSVRIIPLVGCDWDCCFQIQKKILCRISSQINIFVEAETLDGTKGAVKAFSYLSDQILQLHDSLLDLLKTLTGVGGTKRVVFKGIYNGFKKEGLPLGHALDHYDLLDHLMKADLSATKHTQNVLWDGQIPPVLQRAFVIPPHADSAYDNTSCLVCFDELTPGSYFECLDCGHSVCMECFRGYLISASSDGASSIKCPAAKCSTRLSILDIAHILFLSNNPEAEEDDKNAAHTVFSKLFRFAVERYLPVAPSFFPEKKGRMMFCVNPVCNQLLIDSDAEQGDITLKPMYVCYCGTTICSFCRASHFGLECGEFSRLMKEINSGRLCQEIKSGEWLKANTKPCPRCSFPIQKNGGCNHMWCQQCEYYFCWVCGGKGGGCNAYNCNNGQTVWAEKVEDSSERTALSKKATLFFRLQSLQNKLRDIDGAALRNGDSDDFLVERQLSQVLIWLYALALYKSTNETKFAPEYLQDVRDRVEIVAHVLRIRAIAKSLGASPLSLITNYDKKAIRDKESECNVAITPKIAEPSGKRKYSKRKKQSLEEQNKRDERDTYREMTINHELFRLCNEDEDEFSRSASKVLIEAVQAIAQKSRQKNNSRKGKVKKTRQVEGNGTSRKENLSTIQTSWRPWREGYVVDKKGKSGENGAACSNDDDISSTKKQPWNKGKKASKAKRERMREKFSLC